MFFGDSGGSNAYFWYRRGKSAARASQDMAELAAFVQRGFRPPQVVVDRDTAIAETYRLDDELRKANGVIQQWMDYCTQLETALSTTDAELAELRTKNAGLKRDLDIAVQAYQESATEHAALVKRVLDYTRKDKS
jgi:hypothetical protein